MSARRRVPRLPLVVALGLLAALAGAAPYLAGALRPAELATLDARFELRGARPPADVLVVAVDDETFSDLGVQWPFRRSLHAKVVDRLAAAGAARIAYDVQFTEPTRPAEDLALFDAISEAGGVVLATSEVDEEGATNVLGGDENLRAARARAGHANLPPDPGGVIRRLPIALDGLPSFAVAAAVPPGGRLPAYEGPALIDFHGPPGTVPSVPFSRVLRGRFDPAQVRGKTVVVGAAAPTLQDVHATSTSRDELMAGPEVQANALSTARRGFPLEEAPAAVGLGLILLLGLAGPLAGSRGSALRTALTALVLGALYLVAVQLAFLAGLVLPLVYPLIALGVGTLGALGLHYARERWERQWTRALFARFVPEAVVEQLLDRGDAEPRLGGVRIEATVMFCDLRGFTRFAEQVGAEQVIEILNRYLTEMSEAILDHEGTLVSYMGDGIMAVFGSPIEREDHAEAALAAAREMLERRLPSFNEWLAEEGGWDGFRMGIGLNSGPVMSGNVGSERRLEYAAIGDTTNVAARLEAMTKDVGVQLLVGEATVELLRGGREHLEEVGTRALPGRGKPITVFSTERPASGSAAAEHRAGPPHGLAQNPTRSRSTSSRT